MPRLRPGVVLVETSRWPGPEVDPSFALQILLSSGIQVGSIAQLRPRLRGVPRRGVNATEDDLSLGAHRATPQPASVATRHPIESRRHWPLATGHWPLATGHWRSTTRHVPDMRT